MIVPGEEVGGWAQGGVHVPLIGANQANRMHWAEVQRAKDPWRTFGIIAARWLRHKGFTAPVPVVLQVTLPVPDNRRRDPHNYTGTVLKAFVDGLDVGDLLVDDTPDYIHVMDPELRKGDLLVARFYTAKEWAG